MTLSSQFGATMFLKQHQSSQNVTENLFENIFILSWSMSLGILASVLNITIITPLSFAIVWYERHGTDNHRTLLNQLVSSICWNIIIQNMTAVPMDIFLNLHGPLGKGFCYMLGLIKYCGFIHIVLLLTFLTIIRYLYVFVVKNPAGFNNDIWCLFINLFSVLLSILSQLTFLILPGRQMVYFNICAGINISITSVESGKRNYVIFCLILISIFCYTFTYVKIKLLERKSSPQTSSVQIKVKNGWTLPPVNFVFEKNTLANLGTILLCLGVIIGIVGVFLGMNIMSPQTLAKYPYFFIFHFFQHGVTLILNSCLVFCFMFKSETMRNFIIKEVSAKIIWVKKNFRLVSNVQKCCQNGQLQTKN